MEREGYEKKEDQLRPLPIRMVAPPNLGALPFSSDNSVTETKPEISPNQQSNLPLPLPSNNMAPGGTVPSLPANRMLPSGSNNNPSGLAISQGYLPGNPMQARSQSVDQALLQQQQQQQQQQHQQQQIQQQQIQPQNPQQSQMPHSQIQRSGPMLSPNTLSHMIGGPGNQMGANTKLQQLHMIQQQQQQGQQQIHRKMMMGPLGPTGMGMTNNMVGLGAAGLGNIMGMGNMGNIRGMSPTMASAMSALGNINPNQISLTNLAAAGLRPSSMTPLTPAQQNAFMKIKMAQQQRVGMYTQGGLSGMAVGNSGGSNPMLSNSAGLSMMGHNINRANMSQMQRTPTGLSPMGPPKMPGSVFYMNNQQQQQLQMQQQQQQMQQQQQQQQQQQVQQQMQQQMQQIGSPLQQGPVGSPQGGSQQSGMIMPQQQLQQQQMQQISPQQLAALSPQQMSAGAVPQVSNGNNNNSHNGVAANLGGAMPPASPQLSSQTNVSVGSITSSPMEQFQGANKSGGPGSN